MQKFFVSRENINDSKVIITGDDIKHISKVLRKSIGDILIVSDGHGIEYEVKISQLNKEKLYADILQKTQAKIQALEVTLYQALPKLDKMDTIIQKCTELGITKIVPYISEFTVITIDEKKSDKKTERWRKIALEACKQCGRSVIPDVTPIHSFEDMLSEQQDYDIGIFAYEKENSSVKKLLKENSESKRISIIIGPEGGFSKEEARKIVEYGAKSVGLGPRILRTETAGMVVLCIIMYELGGME